MIEKLSSICGSVILGSNWLSQPVCFSRYCSNAISLGFFSGMEGVLCLLCQTLVLSVISRLGTQALRVSGYSADVMNYLTIPANAFAIAAATIIGLALGAGNEEKARQCLRRSLLLALSATVVLAAAALLLRSIVGLCMWRAHVTRRSYPILEQT